MATYSSVLAWRIPGTGEPGGLPSMGSHRVGHDWSDVAKAAELDTTERLNWTVLTWDHIPFFFPHVWGRFSWSGKRKLLKNKGWARTALGFPSGKAVQNPTAIQEPQALSLNWENPLEKEIAIHSSVIAWNILWTDGLAGYSLWGHRESDAHT